MSTKKNLQDKVSYLQEKLNKYKGKKLKGSRLNETIVKKKNNNTKFIQSKLLSTDTHHSYNGNVKSKGDEMPYKDKINSTRASNNKNNSPLNGVVNYSHLDTSIDSTLNNITKYKNKIQKVIKNNNAKHVITLLDDMFNDFTIFTPEYGFVLKPYDKPVDDYLVKVYNSKLMRFNNAVNFIYSLANSLHEYEIEITPNSSDTVEKIIRIITNRALHIPMNGTSRLDYVTYSAEHGKSFMMIKFKRKSKSEYFKGRAFILNGAFVSYTDLTDKALIDKEKKSIINREDFVINYIKRDSLFREYIINSYADAFITLLDSMKKNTHK